MNFSDIFNYVQYEWGDIDQDDVNNELVDVSRQVPKINKINVNNR